MPSEAVETDPTVLASVKNGVSWGEVTGIPADIADGDDGIMVDDNIVLRTKVIQIGSWDMDGLTAKPVAVGISNTNWVAVSVQIIRDDGWMSDFVSVGGNTKVEGSWYAGSTTLYLSRTSYGYYDSTLFNDATRNRGWVVVWYLA